LLPTETCRSLRNSLRFCARVRVAGFGVQRGGPGSHPRPRVLCRQRMIDSEDVSSVARQLAELTRTVEEMQSQLDKFRLGAETQQERADTQQERIDLAARELAEVSNSLQAAARALRQSI
jgi:hypothetical protein